MGKRLLSLLLAVLMVFGSVNISALANEPLTIKDITEDQENNNVVLKGDSIEDVSDFIEKINDVEKNKETTSSKVFDNSRTVDISGYNSIGNILSSTIEESIAGKESNIANVTDILVNGNKATVQYSTLMDSKIIVAIFDEYTEKLSAIGIFDVNRGEGKRTIELQGEIPEYFIAKGFCISKYDNTPLSAAYSTELYTKELKDLTESDINDYSSELVVNLDIDDETNFAVYNEDVIQQQSTVSCNNVSNDSEGNYVITNPTDEIEDLKKGDVVSLTKDDGTVVVLGVKTISEENGIVTIEEDENVSITDVFDYIKIDAYENVNGKDISLNDEQLDDGIVYEGATDIEFHEYSEELEDINVDRAERGVETEAELSSGVSFKIDKTLTDNKNGQKIKFTGKVGVALKVKVKLYATVTRQYASLTLDVTENIEAKLTGSTSAEIYLGELKLPCAVTGVYAHTKCYVYITAAGETTIYCKCKAVVGGKLDAQEGFKDLSEPLHVSDFLKTEVKGSFSVGMRIELGFEFIDSKVCELNVNGKAGLSISAKADPRSEKHNCTGCFSGTLDGVLSVGMDAKFIKFAKLDANIAEFKIKISDIYICGEHNKVELKKCPYKNDDDSTIVKTFPTQYIGDILKFMDITVKVTATRTTASYTDYNYNCKRGTEYRLNFYDSKGKRLFYINGVSQGGTYEGRREDDEEGYSTKPEYKNISRVSAELCDNGMAQKWLFPSYNMNYINSQSKYEGVKRTFNGLDDGKEYVIAIVRNNIDNLISEDNILYINQAKAENGEITLNINPLSDEEGFIYIFKSNDLTLDTPSIRTDGDIQIENSTYYVHINDKLYLYTAENSGIDIIYTLDGSNPKENGVLFDNENPIIVGDESFEIKAYASDDMLGNSEVVSMFVEPINVHDDDIASGTGTDTFKWRIDSEGCLYITGNGDAPYSERKEWFSSILLPEWINGHNSQIRKAIVSSTGMSDMSYWFKDCNNLTQVEFKNCDTTNVSDMSGMFINCQSLKSLDLSSFNTENVEVMTGGSFDGMFKDCNSLESLNVTSFNTSKVTSMNSMFERCYKLKNLDLSSFDTSNVTKMNYMFSDCKSLISLNTNGFNTSNVVQMQTMFRGCKSLEQLDLSNFDISNVGYISDMLENCNSLKKVNSPYKMKEKQYIPLPENTSWYTSTNKYLDSIEKANETYYRYEGICIKGINLEGYEYTGLQIKPNFEVFDSRCGIKLNPKTDYSVKYSQNINVGTGIITITGKGNFKQSEQVDFSIVPKPINGDGINISIADKQYNKGKEIISKPVIKYGKLTLKENKDYTLSYSEDKCNVGIVNVEITGIGNYTDSTSTVYEIYDKNNADKSIYVEAVKDKVYAGGSMILLDDDDLKVYSDKSKTELLTNGIDYSISDYNYYNNCNVGTASTVIEIYGENSNTYKKVNYKIVPKTIQNFDIYVSEPEYSGSALQPSVEVVDEEGCLLDPKYYTLKYINNINVASESNKKVPTIIVKGQGNYKDTVEKEFEIYSKELATEDVKILIPNVKCPNNKQLTEKNIKPVIKYGKTTLKRDKDYRVDFDMFGDDSLQNVGIEFIGNYTGYADGRVRIFGSGIKMNLEDEVTVIVADAKHTGKPVKPKVSIIDNTSNKAIGTSNYTVEYSNNVDLSDTKPTVTIKAKGNNCEGTLIETFRIYKEDISKVFVDKISDQAYTGNQVILNSDSVNVYTDSKKTTKLVEGEDYALEYDENVKVGNGTVIIKGIGKYGNSKSVKFKIVPKKIEMKK